MKEQYLRDTSGLHQRWWILLSDLIYNLDRNIGVANKMYEWRNKAWKQKIYYTE